MNLRKTLDKKQWELCSSLPTMSEVVGAASTQFDQLQYWIANSTTNWIYDPREDAWLALTASGISSVNLTGTSCVYTASGPTGTASAGGASTITTTTNLPGSSAGYTIRITAGTGAGQERVIARNTYGANAVITTATPWSVQPDSTSVYLLLTGRFWLFQGVTTVAMYYFDIATWAWSTARVVTGVSAVSQAWGLVATPAWGSAVASGTATAGSATTLTNSGKAWTTNQWANYQVRITAGTGAGKVATVISNTATALTFATVTTVLDSTSQYVIEPNDDFIYALQGTTTYRYSISGNAWTTLSPGVARSPATGVGSLAKFVGVTSDTVWADEADIKNCRYIYAWRGGSTQDVSIYDIAANSWNNVGSAYRGTGFLTTSGATFAVTTGYSACVDGENVYFSARSPSNANGSIPASLFVYNAVTNTLTPWTSYAVPGSGSDTAGGKIHLAKYVDGATTLTWIYYLPMIPGSGAVILSPLYRMLVI